MKIRETLNTVDHRPWEMPSGGWSYYQEWNDAVFLHWRVDEDILRGWVPEDLEIDVFEGNAWVSLVAFTMEKIRPRYLPHFPPVSNFHEINVRTYVRYKGKTGVYFLSIEGGKTISCYVARKLSELPYRYSKMVRTKGAFQSRNTEFKDVLEVRYDIGSKRNDKTDLDSWLTERYALFQDTRSAINAFEIQHIEWPIFDVKLDKIKMSYPRFSELIVGEPELSHYSPGVQVIAWD